MSALIRPILIEPGATYSLTVEVEAGDTPLNTLGYSARLLVVRRWRPLSPPVLDLSNDDGSEVVYSPGGIITFTATPEQTSLIPVVPGRNYFYTVTLTSPGGIGYRIVAGRAVVAHETGA